MKRSWEHWRPARDRLRGRISWRYKTWCKEVDSAHMALLRQSQSWCRSTLQGWQWKLMKVLLHHAWETVPFYRRRMEAAGLEPKDIRTQAHFRNLPILSRADLRTHPEELISSGYSADQLRLRRSGGSTGEPVRVYHDAGRVRLGTTEEIWVDSWSGWSLGRPVARIWCEESNSSGARWLRKWFRRHVLDPGFVVNAQRLGRDSLERFVKGYRSSRPGLVVGYASALRLLGEFLVFAKVSLPAPEAVISSAELLDDSTRRLLERAFGCPVLDRYGCRETGLIACQCAPDGNYHVNMLRIYLEIVDSDNRPTADGVPGKVLLTDLRNFAMPLIRYEVGDRAVWAAQRSCPCGAGYECLERLEGRTTDFIWSASGEPIHRAWFNSLLLPIPGLRQYRLVQESLRSLRLEIVEGRPIPPHRLRQVRQWIREAVGGDAQVRLYRRSALPQTPSGKYRYVESYISAPPAPVLEN